MNHRTALADWLGDMVAGDREREVADHILAGTALDAAAAHWVSEYPPRCEHPRGTTTMAAHAPSRDTTGGETTGAGTCSTMTCLSDCTAARHPLRTGTARDGGRRTS